MRPSSRELLDKALAEASPEVVARFERVLAEIGSQRDEPDGALPGNGYAGE
ncbi:hypothetical protein AB0M45_20395 [Nocardia sp. NPDC051787]|uniref:hypothetical protein n=1 Tax=Nocardia sp. NPDC051787 TaxID=3155415 RepID=UPI0034367856